MNTFEPIFNAHQASVDNHLDSMDLFLKNSLGSPTMSDLDVKTSIIVLKTVVEDQNRMIGLLYGELTKSKQKKFWKFWK